MLPFCLYLLKVTLLAFALHGYYYFFLRDKGVLRWTRYYLLAIVPFSLGMPLLNFPLRVLSSPAVQTFPEAVRLLRVVPGAGEAESGDAARIPVVPGAVHWDQALAWAYTGAAILLFGLILMQLVRLAGLRRRASCRPLHGALLVETEAAGTPFSFFRWIFWDRRLDPQSAAGSQVLQHELAHVRLRHSLDKLGMQLVCAFFFPVWPYYLVRKELQLVHEYEADRVASGRDPDGYARCLVGHALGAPSARLVQGFRGPSLTRRIAMLGPERPSYRFRTYIALPVALALSALFAFRPMPRRTGDSSHRPLVVVIDPGHGGSEPGAVSHGIREKDLDLQLARTVAWLAPDYPSLRVILTRYRDTTLSLAQRVNIARDSQADVLISLHVNFRNESGTQLPDPAFSGVEAYVSGSNVDYDSSVVLGSLLLHGIAAVYKVAPDLMQRSVGIRVLGQAPCPAALLECGYLSNPMDRAWITGADHQQDLARAILSSLSAYAAGTTARMPVHRFQGTQP